MRFWSIVCDSESDQQHQLDDSRPWGISQATWFSEFWACKTQDVPYYQGWLLTIKTLWVCQHLTYQCLTPYIMCQIKMLSFHVWLKYALTIVTWRLTPWCGLRLAPLGYCPLSPSWHWYWHRGSYHTPGCPQSCMSLGMWPQMLHNWEQGKYLHGRQVVMQTHGLLIVLKALAKGTSCTMLYNLQISLDYAHYALFWEPISFKYMKCISFKVNLTLNEKQTDDVTPCQLRYDIPINDQYNIKSIDMLLMKHISPWFGFILSLSKVL